MQWRIPPFRKRFKYVQGLYSFRITALIVLAAGLLITGLLWASSRQRINQDAYDNFTSSTDELTDSISQRLATYEEILRGGVGLFTATSRVDQDEWHNFIQNYDIADRYPGFAGIGFAKLLHADELDGYVQFVRDNYSQDYAIAPAAGSRNTYVPVVFSENTSNSTRGLGYDLYSEPIRKAAMDMARDSGNPSVTDKILPLTDPKAANLPSFIMFMPIYKKDMPTSTIVERQAAIDGFVYASFRVKNFLDAVSTSINDGMYAMRLYSGKGEASSELLYQTDNASALKNNPYSLSRTKVLDLPGQMWTAAFQTEPARFISPADAKRPLITAISGFIFSITLASFLYMLMVSRARYISRSQQIEVQRAKDDLLSLASHQLRTPATGVKQYLGMVLQGYVGDIDKDQRTMLDKAYESNERQLETINQILYVTKADAGRLSLTKSKFDVIEMTRDVVAEQHESITKRKQKVHYKLHARKQIVNADRQYIRMAIENLVSNASKYSYEGTRMVVKSEVKNSKLYISFSDEGVGIAEDDLDKLFNKFSRIDNDLSVQAGGSGIGLYLSKQVALLHHGDITVTSKLHEGSTFTLVLPIRKNLPTSRSAKRQPK
jgi:signal transduction histidine kinase